jgi:tetratricopeptide (TPR) repeat protein
VKLHWQISAGEFFELFRPVALAISALLSTWVLASALRRGFRWSWTLAWTLGTFFFPFIIFPLYLIARYGLLNRPSQDQSNSDNSAPDKSVLGKKVRRLLTAGYGIVLLSLVGIYFFRDYHSIDAHLARASQAKVMNQRDRAIREYRAALQIEDNPHTHKLLGVELAEASQWEEALRELRAAEGGGEPDMLLPYRLGKVLQELGRGAEAGVEYRKFMDSAACKQTPVDDRCAIASEQVNSTPAAR